MHLYEWEGKALLRQFGIVTPRGVVVTAVSEIAAALNDIGTDDVVVKAQIIGGRRGKHGAVRRACGRKDIERVCGELLGGEVRGRAIASVLVEERLEIVSEAYVAMTYDTTSRAPVLLHSAHGGVDVEEMPTSLMRRLVVDARVESLQADVPFAQALWRAFCASDARLLEINPLVRTAQGDWVAADAKVILDEDASFRHDAWASYTARSPLGRALTEREIAVRNIDAGEAYYRGTAGKYLELDGDIATMFSGGGASIANMDALMATGLRPANYTEYSGNPPREKVRALARVVLSKPGLRGLWIAGGVANFTNIDETFHGIVDALEEVRPSYPIVVRRAGPFDREGMARMRACADACGLRMDLFGKETTMTQTAQTLARLVHNTVTTPPTINVVCS